MRKLIAIQMMIFSSTVVFILVIVADNFQQTDEESPGGFIGTPIDELRCPHNLRGVGPVWDGIEIGVTTFDELKQRYVHDDEPVIIDPFFNENFPGDFAPNYRFFNSSGNGAVFFACIVDDTVAGLLIGRGAARYTSLPQDLHQWIAYLGEPTDISWHVRRPYRILHWPRDGVSVSFEPIFEELSAYALDDWIYLYPYRPANYEDLWPMNNVFEVQPYYTPLPDIELDIFDYDAIQATLAVSPNVWPSATPRP